MRNVLLHLRLLALVMNGEVEEHLILWHLDGKRGSDDR